MRKTPRWQIVENAFRFVIQNNDGLVDFGNSDCLPKLFLWQTDGSRVCEAIASHRN